MTQLLRLDFPRHPRHSPARDLNPELRRRAEVICLQANVPSAWLNACILDVAVLGVNAAAAYVGARPPVLTNP